MFKVNQLLVATRSFEVELCGCETIDIRKDQIVRVHEQSNNDEISIQTQSDSDSYWLSDEDELNFRALAPRERPYARERFEQAHAYHIAHI